MQIASENNFLDNSINGLSQEEAIQSKSDVSGGVVSFQSELPVPLQVAMTSFIEKYPNWDQYRLIQAALAGFLVQNGVESRSITRLYIGNMFDSDMCIRNT